MYSSLAGYVNNVIFALIYSEVAAAIDETASLLYSCVYVHDINITFSASVLVVYVVTCDYFFVLSLGSMRTKTQ